MDHILVNQIALPCPNIKTMEPLDWQPTESNRLWCGLDYWQNVGVNSAVLMPHLNVSIRKYLQLNPSKKDSSVPHRPHLRLSFHRYEASIYWSYDHFRFLDWRASVVDSAQQHKSRLYVSAIHCLQKHWI